MLTVAHLDHAPEHNTPDNLRAFCQRCHLNYDREYHRKQRGKEPPSQISLGLAWETEVDPEEWEAGTQMIPD